MTRTWIVPVVLLLTAGAAAQDGGDVTAAPEAEVSRESVLAAQSLVHEADGLLLTPKKLLPRLDNISPMEALDTLKELQEKAKGN